MKAGTKVFCQTITDGFSLSFTPPFLHRSYILGRCGEVIGTELFIGSIWKLANKCWGLDRPDLFIFWLAETEAHEAFHTARIREGLDYYGNEEERLATRFARWMDGFTVSDRS
jgi:hypothetical protein